MFTWRSLDAKSMTDSVADPHDYTLSPPRESVNGRGAAVKPVTDCGVGNGRDGLPADKHDWPATPWRFVTEALKDPLATSPTPDHITF